MGMRESIIERIKYHTTSFKVVGDVADASALLHGGNARTKINIKNAPGAYLMYVGQGAGEPQSMPGRFTQPITDRWAVIIITRSRNDAGGSKAASKVDDLAKELDKVLLGWQPDGANDGMAKSRNAGRLLKWDTDLHFYAAYYEAESTVGKC